MKKRSCSTLFIAILTITVFTSSSFALSAREIMEKSDNLTQPKTALSDVLMKIHSGGDVTDKEFTLQAMKQGKDDSKALITFSKPTKIKIGRAHV
jgi:hypothetical protein